jgi:hypothetical protein
MPDGSTYEWDGVWGYSFKLLDNRIAQPFSLTPAVVAIQTIAPTKKEFTTVEVHQQALSAPYFLDHIVVTSIFLEWSTYFQAQAKSNAALGKEIGNAVGSAV